MKEKKNYYQNYRNYYLCEIVLLIGWIMNGVFFSTFYEQAVFYIDKKAKFIIQLLFLVNYYFDDLLKYLLAAFVLMTLNVLLLLMFHLQNKREERQEKARYYSMIVFIVIIVISASALLRTIVWPLFLVLFIASLTIVYIIYVITNYIQEEKDESYEENAVVKTKGPFQTKEEAEAYTTEFLAHWTGYFEKKGYRLSNHLTCDEKKEWHIAFTVQLIK